MSQKFGIENIKNVLKLGIGLGEGVALSLEDGKFTTGDITNFLPATLSIPAAVGSFGKLKDELKDLDETERTELVEWVKDEFDIPQDQVEEKIEKGLELAIGLLDYGLSFKKA